MTKDPKQPRGLLSDDERGIIIGLARELLVQNGQLKPDTFLADGAGEVHTKAPLDQPHLKGFARNIYSTRTPLFPKLGARFAENKTRTMPFNAETLIAEHCDQQLRNSHAVFSEKGHFIVRLVQEARGKKREDSSPLIDDKEARRLIAKITFDRNYFNEKAEVYEDTLPQPVIQGPAVTLPARETKIPYRDKVALIRSGATQTLYPGEFLRYVLCDRDGQRFQSPEIIMAFETRIDRSHGYLSSNVFNHTQRLSIPLQEKLVALTGKDSYFWDKERFSSDEATGITFGPAVDLSAINARHAHARDGEAMGRKRTR